MTSKGSQMNMDSSLKNKLLDGFILQCLGNENFNAMVESCFKLKLLLLNCMKESLFKFGAKRSQNDAPSVAIFVAITTLSTAFTTCSVTKATPIHFINENV